MTLTGGDRLGRYELVERLGACGMGEVWRSWDTEFQEMMRLKG